CYGEWDTPSRLIPDLISKYLRNEEAVISNLGQQQRDFVHACDVCRCLLLCLEKAGQLPPASTLEVGAGSTRSIREIAALIKSLVQDAPSRALSSGSSYRENKVMFSRANPNPVRNVLNWKPVISLEDGLTRTIEWQRSLLQPQASLN
ncbi:MAG: NAD-dependent epimerase/dehydratase family protein, partial [Verrucomicrobiota bacterium]